MREWYVKQWNDIKGNVKFAVLAFLASAALTAVGLLTRGLASWQQAILWFILGILLVWAIAVTVMLRSKPGADVPSHQLPEASLRGRVFIFCNELSAYVGKRKTRPDEEKLYAKFKDSKTLFAKHYDAEIQSWDDKLSAGYWLYFRERAVNLRHELVLSDVRDNDLDEALSALERPPKGDYLNILQTVVERLRYAASTLP